MPAKLTTHVLDLASGRPASGMEIEIWRLDPVARRIRTAVTNADGRVAAPLLADEEMAVGQYELVFCVGDYFARLSGHGLPPGGIRFLDRVPVRFGLGEASAAYHIPLLVTPWSYSTYRGS
jgi:5-hydroxyisourate hydrolase